MYQFLFIIETIFTAFLLNAENLYISPSREILLQSQIARYLEIS